MPSINIVICYKSSKGVIKAVRFLLSILSFNWLQLKKKSTSNITLHPINSLKNLLVYSGRFTSLIVTQLIFIVILISWYFLYFFLLIKNHKFLYRLLQYFRVPQASHFYSILITSFCRALGTGKFGTCYTLYNIVLIFNSKVMSLLI